MAFGGHTLGQHQPASNQFDIDCVPIEPLSTYFNISTQYDINPGYAPIELLLTYFNLPQPSVMLVQCVFP